MKKGPALGRPLHIVPRLDTAYFTGSTAVPTRLNRA